MTPAATAVSRTATDALHAKYSAILLAEYPPLFPTTTTPCWTTPPDQPSNERTTTTTTRDDESSYRTLLRRLSDVRLPSQPVASRRRHRQTPLVNAGYAVRVASVLHHVNRFLSFHNAFATTTHSAVQIVILGAGWDVTGLWCDPSVPLDTTTTTTATTTSATTTSATTTTASPSPPLNQTTTMRDQRRHVIEIDMPCVAQDKARAIRQLHVLREEQMSVPPSQLNETHDSIAYQGSSSNQLFRFTLVGADLENIEAVQRLWTNVIQPDVPTLVVCELVLAYLQPSACDALLRWCAQQLDGPPPPGVGHCLLLYEPLGPPPNMSNEEEENVRVQQHQHTPCRSVLESFQHSYSAQFNAKLTRGQAEGTNGNPQAVSYFSPLARSAPAIRERLQRLGWNGPVHAATAGTIASRMGYGHGHHWHRADGGDDGGGGSGTRELFDEHAALALHLSSYSLVCAFADRSFGTMTEAEDADAANMATESPIVDTDLLRRYMCGDWTQPRGLLRSPFCFQTATATNTSTIWITGIQSHDEAQVRSLFSQSYGFWSESYSSIRKMVKSALRTDLGVADKRGTDRSTVGKEERSSVIGNYYWDMEGDFVVAVQVVSHGNEAMEKRDTSIVKTDGLRRTVTRRRVLGAIGIRQWTEKECTSRRSPSSPEYALPASRTFEIQRFFVDTEFRGQGIGSALLTALLQSLRARFHRPLHSDAIVSPRQQRPEIRVIATTPTILDEANRFYTSHQFTVESDVPNGDLTLRTYTSPLWIDGADDQ